MIMHWKPNPTDSYIELEETDKEMFLVRYQNDQYSSLLCDLSLMVETGEDLSKKIKEWERICNLEITSPEIELHIEYLNSGHIGDCTCDACSCGQCMAEQYTGMSTISEFSQHVLRTIRGAFGNKDTSIDDAISYLETERTYEKTKSWNHVTQEEFDGFAARWAQTAKQAAKRLKEYKEKHKF